MNQTAIEEVVKKDFTIIQLGCIFSYIAGALSFSLSIALFYQEVSLIYPIAILITQILDKFYAIIIFTSNSNIRKDVFVYLEIFYLSFIGFNSKANENILRIILNKNYIFFIPMQVLLILLIGENVLTDTLSNLSYTIIFMITVAMLLQLKYKSRVQYYEPGQFMLISSVLKVILLTILILSCSWQTIIQYLVIALILYLQQNYIILLYLSGMFNIYKGDKIYLFMCSLLSRCHGSSEFISYKLQYKYHVCSGITIILIILKSLILLFFVSYVDEFQIYACTLIFQLEMIQPHINTLESSNPTKIMIKIFNNKKEMIPFLQQYKGNVDLVIEKSLNDKKKLNKTYQNIDDSEFDNDEFTIDDQLQLLFILNDFYKNRKNLCIQQYGIVIGEYSFVVEKCVSLEGLYEFLYYVKQIPEPFLYPANYLGVDFKDICENRALRNQTFVKNQYFQIPYNINLENMKKMLTTQSLQVISYFKHLSSYQTFNPNTIIYDLYE